MNLIIIIIKLMRGSVTYGNITSYKLKRIKVYFSLCDITVEKINYIENKTRLNLTEFRQRLKSY